MITAKKQELTAHLAGLVNANEELKERAARPTNDAGSTNSFRSNCLTVLLSPEVKAITTKINGKDRTYAAFAVGYFKEDGTYLGVGTISASALTRNYYPNQGEATDAMPVVENYADFGSSGLEIVQKMFADDACIRFTQKKGVYAPVWNDIAEQMEFSNMTKRDRNFFTIVSIPAAVKTAIES